jgi:hypothetical protein
MTLGTIVCKETPMTNQAAPWTTWSGREQIPAPAKTLQDGRTVTLIATVTRRRMPFGARAHVIPWAVRVEDGGRIEQLRIRDGTALATVALIAGELLAGAVTLWLVQRVRRARDV